MNRGAWLVVGVVLAAGLGVLWAADAQPGKQELTRQLWPPERIEAALQAVERQRRDGLLSDQTYARRKEMLEARKAGTYQPQALSAEDPPMNFIENGSFEQVNRNSAANRSRWLWWNGWSWEGEYENMWEDRPEHVRSGKFSARIRCVGAKGRIGIFTPQLPVVPGVESYKLTFWAKGEGNNELFVLFEGAASGTLRQQIPGEWKQYTILGKPTEGKSYSIYFYATGEDTLWLDDVELVPVGGQLD